MTDLPPSAAPDVDPTSFIVEFGGPVLSGLHFRDRPYGAETMAFCDELVAQGKIGGWFESPAVPFERRAGYPHALDGGGFELRELQVQSLAVSATSIAAGGSIVVTGYAPGSSLAVDTGEAVVITEPSLTLTFTDVGEYRLTFTCPTALATAVSVEVA